MPSASHASDGSRVIRTMTRADLDSACRILVDRGLSAAGFYERMEFRTPGAVFLVRDF